MNDQVQAVVVVSKGLEVPADVESALIGMFGQPSAIEQGDRLYAMSWVKWCTDSDTHEVKTIRHFIDHDDTDRIALYCINEDDDDDSLAACGQLV